MPLNPARLIQFRQLGNWSQTKLARMISVHQGTLSRWEAGVRRPDPEYLARLAAALGVPPAELEAPDNEAPAPGTDDPGRERRA